MFEIAKSDNAESVATATQKALISAIRDFIRGLKPDINAPGLTWEQLDFVLEKFNKTEPTIIPQKFDQ